MADADNAPSIPDPTPAVVAPQPATSRAENASAPAQIEATTAQEAAAPAPTAGAIDNDQWLACFDALGLGGLTRNLAGNCLVESDDGSLLTLRLDPSQEAMQAEVHQTRIERALQEQGMPRRIAFYVAELPTSIETPRQREDRLNQERHAQAVDLLNHDPHVQKLQQAFGAKLIESSVKPADEMR
jgi:DNA polymerase-3 subunit gamma/tau